MRLRRILSVPLSLGSMALTLISSPLMAETNAQTFLTNSPQERFLQANSYYKTKQYLEAIELYLSLLSSEDNIKRKAIIHYNLACTHLEVYRSSSAGSGATSSSHFAEAIYHYLEALRYQPSYKEALHNLKNTLRIGQRTYEISTQSLTVYGTLFSLFRGQMQWLSALFIGVCFSILFLGWRYRHVSLRSRRIHVFILSGLLVAYILSLSGKPLMHLLFTEHIQKKAVVLPEKTMLRLDPSPSAEAIFDLYAGNIVRFENQQQEWVLVSLPNGYQGWILADELLSAKRPKRLSEADMP